MNEKKGSFLSVWILLAGLGATAAAVLWACLDSRGLCRIWWGGR